MRKKAIRDIIIGFLVTLICNLAGMYFYISIFSDLDIMEALQIAWRQNFFSSIIALGAIVDFLPFLVFLQKGNFNYVRGVLISVFLAAGTVLFLKFKYGW